MRIANPLFLIITRAWCQLKGDFPKVEAVVPGAICLMDVVVYGVESQWAEGKRRMAAIVDKVAQCHQCVFYQIFHSSGSKAT